MPLKTDFNKIQSVYDRIIGDYSGREPGTRLPSCRAARLRYDCTRKELEMALAMLKQAGKISVFDRRGIFWNSKSDATYRVSILRTDWPQEYSDTLEAIFAKHLNAHPDISFKRSIIPVDPKVEDYLNVLKSRTCDLAVITCNFTHFSQQDAGRLLNESPVPIIFLENHIVCRAINLIDSKPEFTGMLAADYLIRRGYRKIAPSMRNGRYSGCPERSTKVHGVPQIRSWNTQKINPVLNLKPTASSAKVSLNCRLKPE